MISRYEFIYTREKIKKIIELMAGYEIELGGTYEKWDTWMHMTPQEQEEIRAKWDKYYQDCRNTSYGKRFFSIYPLFKRLDGIKEEEVKNEIIRKIKQIAKDSKADKTPFIKKPTSIDPDELYQKMAPYYMMKAKLEQLNKIYEEYKEVYEKQDDLLK